MAYVIGNFVGRVLVSYLLVFLVCWLFSRFNFQRALRVSTRWYSWLAVVALSALGLGAAISSGGGLQ
jgi:hypothetical protein